MAYNMNEDIRVEDDSTVEPETCEPTFEDTTPRQKRTKPTQFPTSKPGHYSKERRYVPRTKKSDLKKEQVRSTQGKGAGAKKAQAKANSN